MDDQNFSDSDPDALFDSPDTKARKHQAKLSQSKSTPQARAVPKTESRYDDDESEGRDAALRAELDAVRNINTTIESLTASLATAKANMATVDSTIAQSSTLLHTWTRILSATEHNTRLILNPNWHGASADLADLENEERQRQLLAERREREEQERREQAERRAEEEQRRRAAAAAAGPGRTRGTRGRVGAGLTKTPTPAGRGTGYVAVGGQAGRGVSRGTTAGRASSIGTGRGTRGRGRGT